MRDITILMTGCGAPGGVPIIKMLKKNGERKIRIVGADINDLNAGRYLADSFYKIPRAEEPDFVDRLMEICKKEKVDILIPLVTRELPLLSRFADEFEDNGTTVMISKHRAIAIANDKGKLFKYLERAGIRVPRYGVAESAKDVEGIAKSLGYPEKKVVVKPAVSNGSRGLRVLDANVDEFSVLINEKPTNLRITLERFIEIINRKKIPEYVVMEYLPGIEYSCDMLVKRGRSLITIPRRRDIIKEGISFAGRIEENKEISTYAEKISDRLGLDYNINMQFKIGEDGKAYIIEVNPRVSGTIIMNIGAGINLPYLGVKLALGEKIDKLKPKYGITMVRFWSEVFIENSGRIFMIEW